MIRLANHYPKTHRHMILSKRMLRLATWGLRSCLSIVFVILISGHKIQSIEFVAYTTLFLLIAFADGMVSQWLKRRAESEE